MGYLEVKRDHLYLCFYLEEGQEAKLLKASSGKGKWKPNKNLNVKGYPEPDAARIVEIQKSGEICTSFRGARNFHDTAQTFLSYIGHEMTEN